MTPIEELKFNLRESSSPYFTDVELQHLLDRNGSDVNKASYEGLTIKAEDDSIALPGGLNVPSNKAYWLGLAKRYRASSTGNVNRADSL